MNAERRRKGQVRRQHVLAIAVTNALIIAEDADLWLRAHQLATDAVFAARAKEGKGRGCGEDAHSPTKPPSEG